MKCAVADLIVLFALMTCLFVLLGAFLIHVRLSQGNYLAEIVNDYSLMFGTRCAAFSIIYILVFLWVILKFRLAGRICNSVSFTFMAFGIAFIGITA